MHAVLYGGQNCQKGPYKSWARVTRHKDESGPWLSERQALRGGWGGGQGLGKRLESRPGGKMVFALLLSKALALSSKERLRVYSRVT